MWEHIEECHNKYCRNTRKLRIYNILEIPRAGFPDPPDGASEQHSNSKQSPLCAYINPIILREYWTQNEDHKQE